MRYTTLGNTGLRVSEACLGTMTFGEDWGWGATKEESGHILHAFKEAGGNFIDTSINYTDGSSERIIGELLESDRDRWVIATKYSLTIRRDDPNGGGNSRKSMMQAVEESLRRLRTDYIDLYYLHMWDNLTPVEEVMRGFEDLISSGKVLYAGITDTPAWVVAQANTLASERGWPPFAALQLPYSIRSRDAERDLLPMARAFSMSVLTWGMLDGGVLTGKYDSQDGGSRRYDSAGESMLQAGRAVADMARERGVPAAQVAIAWVRAQSAKSHMIPILGVRTEQQMRENVQALELELSADELAALDAINPPNLGFPHTFLQEDDIHELIFGDTYHLLVAR